MPSMFMTDRIVGQGQTKVPEKYSTLYAERWYMLLSAFILNFSYGSLFTSLLPLPTTALDVICDSSNSTTLRCLHFQLWLRVSYPVGFLLGVIPSTLLILRVGILPSLYIAFVSGILSVSTRFIGLFFENWVYLLVLVSHIIHALLHPIGLVLAPTISQYWFPSGQRTAATSLIVAGYFLGFLSSFVLTPNVVDTDNTLKDLIYLTYISYAFALLPLVPMLALRRSRPKLPPSASADDALVNRRCKQRPPLLSSNLLIHCLIFASFAGGIRFTMLLHNQILCLHGYLLTFSGLHALILMVTALTSVVLSGITDTMYGHKQLYKISFALVTISSCVLAWANSSDSKQIFVFLSLVILGLFGVTLYNVAVELSVETCFPANPSKVSAILFSSGYAGELVYIFIAIFARRNKKSPYPIENCQSHGNLEDYSTGQIIITLTLLVFFLLSLICLKWEPARRTHEITAETVRISNVITTNLGVGELRTRC